jgi:hypothetical protein
MAVTRLDPAIRAFVTVPAALRHRAGRDFTLPIRIATVLAALAILYVRSPITFIHPQLFVEDAYLFHASRFIGWAGVSINWAGYLVVAQFLVALFASYFSPVYAAALFCYAAIAFALIDVWIVTSPRLDLPCKPLLALAIVIVPSGQEELGVLAYIQWIMPIGVFAFLFMRAAKFPIILLLEAAFAFVSAVSGPFSIFLAPLFVWQMIRERDEHNRLRLIALTTVNNTGALVQLIVIARHPAAINQSVSAPYSWMDWVDLPFWRWMSDFGPVYKIFAGPSGTVLALLCLTIAVMLALRPPYRTQKIFMLFFSVAVAVSGMYKFRTSLGGQLFNQRYFYAGSVFAIWFICCLFTTPSARKAMICIIATLELLLLPAVANTPKNPRDTEWPVWAGYISSGLPVIIPIAAPGWYIGIPAAQNGPLASFAGWISHGVPGLPGGASGACGGTMGSAHQLVNIQDPSALGGLHHSERLWATSGWAWDNAANAQVKLVVLVNAANTLVGFGLPGFRHQDGGAPPRSAWNAVLETNPGAGLHAYTILQDGTRCPLPGQS